MTKQQAPSVSDTLRPMFCADFWKAQVSAMHALSAAKASRLQAVVDLIGAAARIDGATEADVLSAIDAHVSAVHAEYRTGGGKGDVKAAMKALTGTGSAYLYFSWIRTIITKGAGLPAILAGEKALSTLYREATAGDQKPTETGKDVQHAATMAAPVVDPLADLRKALEGLPADVQRDAIKAATAAALKIVAKATKAAA